MRCGGRGIGGRFLTGARILELPGSASRHYDAPVLAGRSLSRAERRPQRCAALVIAVSITLGACDHAHTPTLPPAEVYEEPVAVQGHWRGEVAGLEGILDLTPLGRDRYRGVFEARGRLYVLNIVHVRAPGKDGVPEPSNLLRFDWQDGRGDRGAGWLIVNEDGSMITGSFGRGDGNTEGAGQWTMVRNAEDTEGDS
jgi:hypothetical protein